MKCMKCKKRTIGLIAFSLGIGMLLTFLIPCWGFIMAAVLIIFGFFQLFC